MMEKWKQLKLTKFGKRQMILAGLMVLVAVAGYINLNFEDVEISPASNEWEDVSEPLAVPVTAPVEKTTATPAADRFAEARLEREKSRSAAMDVYRELISNKDSSEEVKAKAQADLSASAKAMENETALEQLIKAKGFENPVVYISENSVTIMVKAEKLLPAQVAQIKDMAVECTGRPASQIKVSEID